MMHVANETVKNDNDNDNENDERSKDIRRHLTIQEDEHI